MSTNYDRFGYKSIKRDGDKTQVQIYEFKRYKNNKYVYFSQYIILLWTYLTFRSFEYFNFVSLFGSSVKKRFEVVRVPSVEISKHLKLSHFIFHVHDPVLELLSLPVYFYKFTSNSIYNCCHSNSSEVNKISTFESI